MPQKGDKGKRILMAQEWLCTHGIFTAIDGDFGPATERALTMFQEINEIPVNGILTDLTVTHLASPLADAIKLPKTIKETLDTDLLPPTEIINTLAEHHAYLKPREVGGENMGPWVRYYTGGHEGRQFPWCVEGETEILTENGWIRFDKLNVQHGKVAQVIPETLEIQFVTPIEYIKKNYSGELYTLKNRCINITTDKDHRFFGKWNKGNNKFKSIKEINASGLSIPVCKTSANGVNLTNDELDLIAAFVADGFMHRGDVEFQVSKERKIKRLKELNPSHNYKAPKPYGNEKVPRTTLNFKEPKYFNSVFNSYKFFKWSWVLSLSHKQALHFLLCYNFWDGQGHGKKDSHTITTTNSHINEVLTALAVLGGVMPSCKLIPSRSGFNGKEEIYRISFCKNKKSKTIRQKDITRYKDKKILYCVAVPSGAILIRDKQGNPFITGNCAGFVSTILKQANTMIPDSKWKKPSKFTLSCDILAEQAKKNGKFRKGRDKDTTPKSGWVFLVRRTKTDWIHCGFVTEAHESCATTIEGNTNDVGSREGYKVCRRIRSYRSLDFIEP